MKTEFMGRLAALRALGENPDPDAAAKLFGNIDATYPPKCDDCRGEFNTIICFRESRTRPTFICMPCLQRATRDVMEAIEGEQTERAVKRKAAKRPAVKSSPASTP